MSSNHDAPPQEEKPILRNAKIIEVTTDEEGYLNVRVELPEEMLINVNADTIALAYLVGTCIRFLSSILESSAKGVMDRAESAEIRKQLSLPGKEN